MKQHDQWATECAKDLYNQAKSSFVVAGSHLPDSVHLLTYKINKVLGNQTTCLTYLETENSFDDLASMCDALNKDDIDTVIFLSGNPVYHVPSIDWSDLLKNTKSTFRLVMQSMKHRSYVITISDSHTS